MKDIWTGKTSNNNDKTEIGDKSGANSPNITNIANKTYITWAEKDGTYEINDTQKTKPSD